MPTNHKQIPELCKGCAISENDSESITCTLIPTYKGIQWPCASCLVKTTCIIDGDECDIYSNYEFILD